jgi:anhydro-N-acetylmuramic acid kinase
MPTIVGLMSGTSMDGVDAAVLATDGVAIAGFGPTCFRPYSEGQRAVLRQALVEARDLTDRAARPGIVAQAERIVTEAHRDAARGLMMDNGLKQGDVALIGFHGQTVFHAPERGLTVQIGDAAGLARDLGIAVVYDFRAADVAAGGQGAPFVPVYHQALVRRSGLPGNVVVVNIGGVANITRIGADGSLAAGDTGPGNALLDDFVQERTGQAMDAEGVLASRGEVNADALRQLLANPWFDLPLPKSLDRNAFSLGPVGALGLEDGAATLAAFTAETIARAITAAGGADAIVVAGGGAHNPTLLGMLGRATHAAVRPAADLGWSGDFIEAQAFAFLAARSVAGLPLSFPGTTGVPAPMTGGLVAHP